MLTKYKGKNILQEWTTTKIPVTKENYPPELRKKRELYV